ncbi:MAG TPA: hypothetical protein VFC78_23100 [Tepidisphaeraceae bacterium]|nr:hypothetical protein [Tepidisphaeraceae bacterium]
MKNEYRKPRCAMAEALEGRRLLRSSPFAGGVESLPTYSFVFGPQNRPAEVEYLAALPNGGTFEAGVYPVSAGGGGYVLCERVD